MSFPLIFVQIAAYRDRELIPTILDALAKADEPESITFGVVWQASSAEEDQWQVMKYGELAYLQNRLRVIPIPWNESKGVGYARLLCQKLWEREPFTLQIDAHARFVQGWDKKCINWILSLKNKSAKPLLTCYAPSYLPPGRLNWWQNPETGVEEPIPANQGRLGVSDCFDDPKDPNKRQLGHSRDEQGFYHFPFHSQADWMILRPSGGDSTLGLPAPVLGIIVSGHFIFTEGIFNQDVIYDPDIYFLGEEVSLSVRAWTHGYDIYYPNEQVCYHYYTGAGRRRHWEDHPETMSERDRNSFERVLHLFGTNRPRADLSPYGFGNIRTLEQYEYFAGVHFASGRFNEFAMRGYPSNETTLNYLDLNPYKNQAQLVA